MDIRGKTVLVLGGYGLVGQAVCKLLMAEEPARLIIASLKEEEARSTQAALRQEFPDSPTEVTPAWGNIFVRHELKDLHPTEIYAEPELRRKLISDIFDELDEETLTASFLYQLITGEIDGHPAEIVIDCVNTATGLAYQNIYRRSADVWDIVQSPDAYSTDELLDSVQQLLIAQYTPQLVRHVQLLYQAFKKADTQAFVKVGTSGTGGMGLNIPFTHGEEKPSRVLLSKAAMAGAHSLLIFLLGRTPDAPPVVKEVKPTAAIAWKKIAYGPVGVRGNIELYDCPPDEAAPLEEALQGNGFGRPLGRFLENVYIDTGENGVFSLDEFKAITTLGQMMFITPQEIARAVVGEILGTSTGKDIVSALDASVMGPTYRAGFLRGAALERMEQLQRRHEVRSVAFEFLGPPRLSKLLFEAHLLERAYKVMSAALKPKPEVMSERLWQEICDDQDLRAQILSIGIPILLPDGKQMLRGPEIKSDTSHGGWVDLTPDNMMLWQKRLLKIIDYIDNELDSEDTSSEMDRTFPAARMWVEDQRFDVGEIAGWIFIHEEHGLREKSY